jgi:hypothetical protein
MSTDTVELDMHCDLDLISLILETDQYFENLTTPGSVSTRRGGDFIWFAVPEKTNSTREYSMFLEETNSTTSAAERTDTSKP